MSKMSFRLSPIYWIGIIKIQNLENSHLTRRLVDILIKDKLSQIKKIFHTLQMFEEETLHWIKAANKLRSLKEMMIKSMKRVLQFTLQNFRLILISILLSLKSKLMNITNKGNQTKIFSKI